MIHFTLELCEIIFSYNTFHIVVHYKSLTDTETNQLKPLTPWAYLDISGDLSHDY